MKKKLFVLLIAVAMAVTFPFAVKANEKSQHESQASQTPTIVIAIDDSGSMAPFFQAAKDQLKLAIRAMPSGVRIVLIAFSTTANLETDRVVSDFNRDEIVAAIDGITADGDYTNFEPAVDKVKLSITDIRTSSDNATIVFISDEEVSPNPKGSPISIEHALAIRFPTEQGWRVVRLRPGFTSKDIQNLVPAPKPAVTKQIPKPPVKKTAPVPKAANAKPGTTIKPKQGWSGLYLTALFTLAAILAIVALVFRRSGDHALRWFAVAVESKFRKEGKRVHLKEDFKLFPNFDLNLRLSREGIARSADEASSLNLKLSGRKIVATNFAERAVKINGRDIAPKKAAAVDPATPLYVEADRDVFIINFKEVRDDETISRKAS